MMASRWLPVGLVIIAMASIQAGASLAKQLFPVLGPQGATAIRLAFAAIILLLVLRPWRRRLTRQSWRPVVIYGVAMGGMNLMLYMAIARIPLGVAVALEFTGPLAVAILSSRRAIDFLWIGLAVVGLALLLPIGTGVAEPLDPVGAAYALGAGICWALYILFGQKAGVGHGTQTAALGVTIAALIMAPVGIAHAGAALLSPSLLPYALGVAVLSTALPYTLEMFALARMPTRTFGTLMSIEPAFGALSGLVFLQEYLTLIQWLAIGAIMLASVGTTMTMVPSAMGPAHDTNP